MNTQVLQHKYSATDYSNVADYQDPLQRGVIQRDMQRISYFQRYFSPDGIAQLEYDLATFPFPEVMKLLLQEKGVIPDAANCELGDIHHALPAEQMALDSSGINEVSRKLYETNQAFQALYRDFVMQFICHNVLKKTLLFQNNPTVRCYFPKARGFAWRPNYHCDIMLGHPPQEINIWLPFTHTYDSNSLRLLKLQDSIEIMARYDFNFVRFAESIQQDDALQEELHARSFVVETWPGQVILFDSRCLHVMQENRTNHTRISMDLRVILQEEYEALNFTYVGTGRRKMPFAIGEYYDTNVIQP